MDILDHGPVFILSRGRALSQWDDRKWLPWPMRELKHYRKSWNAWRIPTFIMVTLSPLPRVPRSADIMMSLSESRMSPAYCSALGPLSCPIWSMPHFSNHLSAFQLNIMLWEGTDLQRLWLKLEALCLFYQPSLSTVYGHTVLLYKNRLIVGKIICKSSWAQSPLNKIFALLCLLELIYYDNEHSSRLIWIKEAQRTISTCKTSFYSNFEQSFNWSIVLNLSSVQAF